MLKIIFTILWLISLLIWNIYAIRTIIEIKKDRDYLRYCIKNEYSINSYGVI